MLPKVDIARPGWAKELHAEALSNVCTRCRKVATLAIRSFCLSSDLPPDRLAAIAAMSDRPGSVPMVRGKRGEVYVRVGQAYSCDSCRRDLERQAALLPSYCYVEIDEVNPKAENTNIALH